jgi:hypothetical protein
MSKEPFNIMNEEEFHQLMESIDEELRNEHMPIAARPLAGWGKISARFNLGLKLPALDRVPQDGCYTGDDLTIRILHWFDHRYGRRLKKDPTWKMAIIIRGDAYRMLLPLSYGIMHAMCSPKDFGSTKSNMLGSQAKPPTVNILDLIDGLTEEYAKKLNKEELSDIAALFGLGLRARTEMESVFELDMIPEAIGDLHASVVHLFDDPVQCGLSKWASLQATEKVIKSFLILKKKPFGKNHILDGFATAAESVGLRVIPRGLLDKVQCSAGVRYGDSVVNMADAVEAHHACLDICLGVANQIFLHRHYRQAVLMKPGKFYTNSLGKYYRCIEVSGDKAKIMVFDEPGVPIAAIFIQDRRYWNQYFEIDESLFVEQLEKRYQSLISQDVKS